MQKKEVFIIAEAGINHNGDFAEAKKLVDIAVEAGVDSVKFQTFKTEQVISKYARKAAYQKDTTGVEESQFEMAKKLELSDEAFCELLAYCREKKILFLSSPFDLGSIDFLVRLEMPIFKIPSGEITNLPYLQRVAVTGKPVILSTGMSTLGEIEAALNLLAAHGCEREKVTLLHCNTEYPTPMEDVNLNSMLTLKAAFPGLAIGYSDHTLGTEIPIAAVALGAQVIEKHFTSDKTMAGPDHRASLDPDELKAMVHAIRNIEVALGTGIKEPSSSEMKNIDIARKSIVAIQVIREGDEFTPENLGVKRPGNGISPMRWHEVLGKTAVREFQLDELIEL
jgi:N,N'-diacetyllegionaminate synthase